MSPLLINLLLPLHLGLHVQELHKSKPAKISASIGEGLMKSHLFLRSYWQLIVDGGRESWFSSGIQALGDSSYFRIQSYTHLHIGSTKWTQWVIINF